MRVLGLVAALLACLASVSLAGEPAVAPGLVWSPKGAVLTRVDAVSRLELPNERTVLLGYAHYSLSTSPDGVLLASTSGIDRNVHLSDLDTLSPTPSIGPLPEQIRSTHWIGRRTLIASSASTIAVLDVNARTVRTLIPVDGSIVTDASAPGHYVALVAPLRRIGALRVVSVTPAGRVRTVAIPAIRGGLSITRNGVRVATPGLALAADGQHAYVLARGSRVVAVDLATARARLIAIRADRTLQAMAKSPPTGWQRTSRLLGTTLVSTGTDFTGREYTSFTLGGTPTGLRLTNLRTHRTHIAVAGSNQFRICDGLIVAVRMTPLAGAGAIVALDRRGRPLWSQFAGQGARLAGCARGYVYLWIEGAGFATLDVRSGAVLETHRGSVATVIELR
jgi:WD40 repeat protein